MTNSENIINRKLVRKRDENESKREDMKQHADKLIQGFEKLEESHSRRAVWELFQNAIDLSENCEIIIEQRDDGIIFKHNGLPFTSKTLRCLIKQVSSKSSENNNDEVGQYGTGFITTHSFGKKILVSGSLKEGDYFIPIQNFEIDRIIQKPDDLIDKIIAQQQKVFDLIEYGELKTECNTYTSFYYKAASPLEQQNIIKAIDSLIVILPYVMRINKKLNKVKVYDINGTETIYRKGETSNGDNITTSIIHINQNIKKIFSLVSEVEDLVVVLPLSEKNKAVKLDKYLSKLFLYYPLIGTENFGFNYLIHSKQFAPTEPRDGIHLRSKNEQVQEKEKNNRSIIEKASALIFEFVEKYALEIENPKLLGYINFNTGTSNTHLSEYFIGLKKKWVEKFKGFPIVETDEERLNANEVNFLSSELLLDEDYYDSVYFITNLFWKNIPKKQIARSWTKNISFWEDENISYITVEDIVNEIEKTLTLDFYQDTIQLQKFYEYLIKYSFSKVFNQHKILPNIKNEFRLLSQLNSTNNIDEILIEVADTIVPEIPKRYIKSGFELNLGFEPYDRKHFSKDINSQISELNKTIKEGSVLEQDTLQALILYCRIFPATDNTGTRGVLIKQICEYYSVDSSFISLPTVANQEIEWLTPIKCLLRNFIWELNTKDESWVESNSTFLSNVLSIIHSYYEYGDIVKTHPIFPNQLFKLCEPSELKKDGDISDELKDLFDRITQPQKKVRSTLILSGFSKYLKDNDTKYSKNLGDSIDKVFQDAMSYTEINKHPYKKDILWIIKKISDDNKWSKYFPFIEEKKATIMMARISNTETKNDLFSIIGLESKHIALLGELSRDADLERIINLGKIALEEENREKADFQFKHTIGTHIEKLIRDKIGIELEDFQIKVRDEQGGQDIVVKHNNSILYYIEVKSRWDSRNSITMSPLQMKNAVQNKDNYSLCCVDMCNYKIGEKERYSVSNIQEIINRIQVLNDIGSRLKPILDGVLSVKDIENEISLSGDYRGTIPQPIVRTGESLDNLIDNLIKLIEPILQNANA
ncbi:protein of unknown function [Reichenbachiella faecimaris]|uniref:Protein NO VEIN C-terminal domain-containing protein n=1 Tax=Reichenbachiella faecimaris TaxID=692418 RepID=A0A1W2GQL6_REIFA|nr:DUF3883 domain-containing protein [Reichenbachiella faecimaris]SMD38854.1 protein of unknown function [Reichenbachiella faecimaris]